MTIIYVYWLCHVLPYRGPLPVNFNPSLLGVCWFCHYASNHGNIITDVKAAVQAMSQSDLSEVSYIQRALYLCQSIIESVCCSSLVW